MKMIIRMFLIAGLVLAGAIQQVPLAQQPKDSTQTKSETPPTPPGPGGTSLPNADPFQSTYKPFPRRTTLIRNATIMTAAGPSIQNGSVLLRDGKIAAAGTTNTSPVDAFVIDGRGKYLTPRIIHVHSHTDDYPSPGVDLHRDGNKATKTAR